MEELLDGMPLPSSANTFSDLSGEGGGVMGEGGGCNVTVLKLIVVQIFISDIKAWSL